MKKIACILARVSRVEQDPTSQIEVLKKDAQSLLHLDVKDEYVFQERITGLDSFDKDERESLATLKQCIESNADKQMYCFMWELTRLSRNPWFLMEQLNWFNQHKVPIYFHDIRKWTLDIDSLQENADTSNIIFGAATYGQQEVEKIKQRTSRGRDAKAEKGYYVGHLSDGYMVEVTREGKKIVEDKERSQVIKRIFNLFIEGNSTDRIADILNSENIPTTNAYRAQSDKFGHKNTYHLPFDRRTTRKRSNAKWAGTHITNILKNEWYNGVRIYNDREYEVDKIIDDETWEKAKAQREKRAISFRSEKKTKHAYLLSNLIYCGQCGRKLYGHYTGLNNHYYCSSVDEGSNCGLRGVCKENVEGIIYDVIKRHTIEGRDDIFSDFFKLDKKEVARIKKTINVNDGVIAKLEKDKEKSDILMKNYGRLIAESLDDEVLKVTYKALQSEERHKIDSLSNKINDIQRENRNLTKKLNDVKDLDNRLDRVFTLKDNLDAMKDLFQTVVTKVKVYNATPSITILNVEYINNNSDILLYSPRLLKSSYILISDGLIIFNKPIHIRWLDKTRMIYCKEDKSFHFEGVLKLYTDEYKVVKSGLVFASGEEHCKEYKFETTTDFQSPISADELVRRLQHTCYPLEYHRLEEITEEGKAQQEKNKQWRKKYNTGKPTCEPYVVKDEDYEKILKEKKHLYNRTYKIKKNKKLSDAEKRIRLDEVKERIALLSAQVKYIEGSRRSLSM